MPIEQQWPTIFPNATCATALIDRLAHYAELVSIEGGSCRRREAEEEARAQMRQRGEQSGPKSHGKR